MKRLYNKYFPTPSFLAINSCAIDISDQSIKYGELSATSQGLVLRKYGKEQLPEGIVVSGKIEKEEEFVRVLKNIKDKENFHFVRVSLPEEQMYLFTLSLPKVSNSELRGMILLQIEEHIPLKAPDSVFDFDVIQEDEQGILVEVVAVATLTLEKYLSVFKKAGLVPISFEIESQAIARAVIPSEENNPTMIVDFGGSRTVISICRNGRVFLTTTLAIGGTDLTNMIAKNFSIPFLEAEKMKHEYSLKQESKAQSIFSIILNEISVLRDELNKQCAYWENHHDKNKKEEQISKIILCGGNANLAGLADYLESTMKIKVENANIWVNILDKNDQIPDMSFEDSLSYATVVGLSLGGYLYKSQPVINILPQAEKKVLHRDYWLRFFVVVLNLIAITSVIASLLLFPSYFLSKLKENIVENRLESFNKENPSLKDNNIEKITKEINLKLKNLDKQKPLYQVSDYMENILSSRTSGITFSQILFNKNMSLANDGKYYPVVEIHGIALNRDSLRNFKTALDNNPNFSKVNLPISDFLEKTNLPFTISITMK
ncbi:MAG TPA: type II secretion system protein GspL [Candidatus Paceibacterota bacterium]|nr:type II secretion system protein GspL [Candidatus Paceibacterota bacterium]